ncbi:MAG TPA: hypothetical protein VKU60_08110 [Chloroflexota bacterium]|nr:hypothetical protein [Chloroflexota bacterium]
MNQALMKERQALLALELVTLGVDVRRLGFLQWLIQNGQDPEWCLSAAAEPALSVQSA